MALVEAKELRLAPQKKETKGPTVFSLQLQNKNQSQPSLFISTPFPKIYTDKGWGVGGGGEWDSLLKVMFE